MREFEQVWSKMSDLLRQLRGVCDLRLKQERQIKERERRQSGADYVAAEKARQKNLRAVEAKRVVKQHSAHLARAEKAKARHFLKLEQKENSEEGDHVASRRAAAEIARPAEPAPEPEAANISIPGLTPGIASEKTETQTQLAGLFCAEVATVLGRIKLEQFLILLCTKHELDIDGLMVCELDVLLEMELPPAAAAALLAEVCRLRMKTQTHSSAEIKTWNEDEVASWLVTTLGTTLTKQELEGLVSVELEGDDLAEASGDSVKGLCKKVAKRRPDLDWAKMRAAVIAARDKALGMGQMEQVGPEFLFDRSEPLGFQVWVGQLGDGRRCAVKQVEISQGQKEHELLSRIREAGRCAHVIDYYSGFEKAADGRYYLAMVNRQIPDILFCPFVLIACPLWPMLCTFFRSWPTKATSVIGEGRAS